MYYQESFKPEGHELSDEIRYLQAKKTLNMMINFLKAKNLKPYKQMGKSSYSRRKTPEDSEVNINDTIKNQNKILITGASGNLGQEIFKNLSKHYNVTGTYYKNKLPGLKKLNLVNFIETKKFVEKINPNIVIHLSAFTNPSLNEKFKKLSKVINLISTRNLTKSLKKKTKFIFFSTDKVYRYQKHKKSYKENSICKSNFVYGVNKYLCEKIIKKKFKNYIILRIPIVHSNSVKKNFSFLNNCIHKLKQKRRVKVYSNIFRSFVSLDQLITLVKILIKSRNYGIYNIGTRSYSYSERLKYICKKMKIIFKGAIDNVSSDLNDKRIILNTEKLKRKFKFKFN